MQFPQRCSDCGKIDVYCDSIPYEARVKHDGCFYTFSISKLHVLKCRSCNEVLFDNTTDDQISQGLREHLKLLSPQEIRDQIERFGLNQKEFAQKISVAPETVSRWLSGAYIQSRAMDKLMRLFFDREDASGSNLESCPTTFTSGELAPWGTSVSYQIETETPTKQDTVDQQPPVYSDLDVDEVLEEMARGPPSYKAL